MEAPVPDHLRWREDRASLEGRVPLLTYVLSHLQTGEEVGGVQERVGVAPDLKLPVDTLAVWLFRDLQAADLTARNGSDE